MAPLHLSARDAIVATFEHAGTAAAAACWKEYALIVAIAIAVTLVVALALGFCRRLSKREREVEEVVEEREVVEEVREVVEEGRRGVPVPVPVPCKMYTPGWVGEKWASV